MKDKGYIQVYTGNGKGKTTAAIGLAVRAAGRGKKTYIAQFMKKGEYGELIAITKYLSTHIQVEQFGSEGFHYKGDPVTKTEREKALAGIKAVEKACQSNQYDIVVLDEINVLLYFRIIDVAPVLSILNTKPDHLELVLTGRYAPEEILKRADLITEMRELKHYLTRNIPDRLGIEK
jgi:cob(I)alamin adenosyltransferase